jgi:prepilin-type N-terminal cleavage/methylation domain-containing protein
MQRRKNFPERRKAVTLVEVLVAIVVSSVGLIALATTGAALLIHGASALAGMNAGATSRTVVDSLRAAPCASLVSGSSAAGPTSATWTVSGVGAVRGVASSVTSTARRSVMAQGETTIPCQ